MSDQSQSFGGPSTTVAEPQTDSAELPKGGPKPIVFVIGGLVLAVVAAAAYFLLFSGGGGTDDSTGLVPGAQTHTSTAPSAKSSAKPSTAPSSVPVAAGVGTGKDPFLNPDPPPVAPSGVGTAAPSSTAAPVGGAGTTVPAGTTVVLKVVSVNPTARTASVTVNGKATSVTPGVLFGSYFTLVGFVDTGCASFNFGDVLQVPKLCTGQSTTLKT